MTRCKVCVFRWEGSCARDMLWYATASSISESRVPIPTRAIQRRRLMSLIVGCTAYPFSCSSRPSLPSGGSEPWSEGDCRVHRLSTQYRRALDIRISCIMDTEREAEEDQAKENEWHKQEIENGIQTSAMRSTGFQASYSGAQAPRTRSFAFDRLANFCCPAIMRPQNQTSLCEWWPVRKRHTRRIPCALGIEKSKGIRNPALTCKSGMSSYTSAELEKADGVVVGCCCCQAAANNLFSCA